ncbi:MAG TPA: dTDP-4-dehydrorhamnose 3,5-epimerase [Stellaceae bacterium]
MIFTPTRLGGLWLVEMERHADERGYFARSWCRREFAEHGLDTTLAQASVSFNAKAGTLRGMHFQRPPHAETKLVRCTRGAIWDVAIDLRSGSSTRGQWQGFELSAENGAALYIPEGFAHGFQTLVPDTEVFYQISRFHVPEAASGVRYDDPAFGVSWPLPVSCISPRDATWPDCRLGAEATPA